MNSHILITGKPRSGKTTLIKNLILIAKENYSVAGFYTEEILKKGKRIGFNIRTLEGETGILALTSNYFYKTHSHLKYHKLGRYMVFTSDIETITIPEFYKEAEIFFCDEIGKMELFSSKFKESILFALDKKPFLIATISLYNLPFILNIKNRQDTTVLELTLQNRKRIINIISSEFKNRIK